MKRFLMLLSLLFCNTVCADTITLKWFNEGQSEYTTTTCQTGEDIILPQTTPVKRGYTFVGWKKADYVPIQYIEGIGGGLQRIDTGINSYLDSHIAIKISTVSAGSGDCIMGSYRGIGFSIIGVNYFYLFLGVTQVQGRSGYTAILEQNGHQSFIDGNLIGTVGGNAFQSGKIYILSNGTDSSNAKGVFRIHWAKIWKDDTLQRDFIPVLDSNGIPCLYDKVSEQYFYDENGNSFNAGPVI